MRKNAGLIVVFLVVAGAVYFFTAGPFRSLRPEPGLPAEQEVTLYFSNREYIETGSEELPKTLPVSRTVKTGGTEDFLVKAVLAELRTPPAGEHLTTALRDDLNITGARVEGTTAYVDFSPANLHGGSLEEILLVEQIVKSLTALPGIEKVQFLVNGERRDTLMGHIGTHEPLSREDV